MTLENLKTKIDNAIVEAKSRRDGKKEDEEEEEEEEDESGIGSLLTTDATSITPADATSITPADATPTTPADAHLQRQQMMVKIITSV